MCLLKPDAHDPGIRADDDGSVAHAHDAGLLAFGAAACVLGKVSWVFSTGCLPGPNILGNLSA